MENNKINKLIEKGNPQTFKVIYNHDSIIILQPMKQTRIKSIEPKQKPKTLRQIVLEGFEKMNKRLDNVDKRLDVVEDILERHGQILKRHGQILKRHGQILKRHGQILEHHGEILKHQDQILKRNNLK